MEDTDQGRAAPQRTTSLSRRELLRRAGYGTAALTLAALSAGSAGAAAPLSRLERLLPGTRELRRPSALGPRANPGPTQMQYPFWGGDWSLPQYYETILLADFDGDGKAELLGRYGVQGMIAFKFTGGAGSS
jgi:hypothetical protein